MVILRLFVRNGPANSPHRAPGCFQGAKTPQRIIGKTKKKSKSKIPKKIPSSRTSFPCALFPPTDSGLNIWIAPLPRVFSVVPKVGCLSVVSLHDFFVQNRFPMADEFRAACFFALDRGETGSRENYLSKNNRRDSTMKHS